MKVVASKFDIIQSGAGFEVVGRERWIGGPGHLGTKQALFPDNLGQLRCKDGWLQMGESQYDVTSEDAEVIDQHKAG